MSSQFYFTLLYSLFCTVEVVVNQTSGVNTDSVQCLSVDMLFIIKRLQV